MHDVCDGVSPQLCRYGRLGDYDTDPPRLYDRDVLDVYVWDGAIQ